MKFSIWIKTTIPNYYKKYNQAVPFFWLPLFSSALFWLSSLRFSVFSWLPHFGSASGSTGFLDSILFLDPTPFFSSFLATFPFQPRPFLWLILLTIFLPRPIFYHALFLICPFFDHVPFFVSPLFGHTLLF